MPESAATRTLVVPIEAAGRRLDQYLVEVLTVSRARVQWLLSEAKVLLEGKPPDRKSVV